LLAVLAGITFASSGFDPQMMTAQSLLNVGGIAVIIGYLGLTSILSAFYKARIRNHIVNNCEFEQLSKFESRVKVLPFAMLMLTNMLAILCTAGFAYPWAAIRSAKFMAEATKVVFDANAQAVIDTMEEQQASFGEEAAEIFDVDVSLG